MNIRVRDAKKDILKHKSGYDESATKTEIANYGTEQLGESKTLGFRPTCKCNADIIPCTVLDPFCGSGTSGNVAIRMGRRYIGIDLKYHNLAEDRMNKVHPLFNLPVEVK